MQFYVVSRCVICASVAACCFFGGACRRSNNDVATTAERDAVAHSTVSRSDIIRVADEAAAKQLEHLRDYRRIYDTGNKLWADAFPAPDPNLAKHEYQVVKYERKGLLPATGGALWICVDREDGQILKIIPWE